MDLDGSSLFFFILVLSYKLKFHAFVAEIFENSTDVFNHPLLMYPHKYSKSKPSNTVVKIIQSPLEFLETLYQYAGILVRIWYPFDSF